MTGTTNANLFGYTEIEGVSPIQVVADEENNKATISFNASDLLISTDNIDGRAVTSDKLANGAVTEQKLDTEVQRKLNKGAGRQFEGAGIVEVTTDSETNTVTINGAIEDDTISLSMLKDEVIDLIDSKGAQLQDGENTTVVADPVTGKVQVNAAAYATGHTACSDSPIQIEGMDVGVYDITVGTSMSLNNKTYNIGAGAILVLHKSPASGSTNWRWGCVIGKVTVGTTTHDVGIIFKNKEASIFTGADAWQVNNLTDLISNSQLIEYVGTELDNYYTKSEIDTTLGSYYTSSEIDTLLASYETTSHAASTYVATADLPSYGYTTASDVNSIVNAAVANKQDKPLVNKNIKVGMDADCDVAWAVSSDYGAFNYKADIPLTGADSTMITSIGYDYTALMSGTCSPFCVPGTDKVTIYSTSTNTIVVEYVKAETAEVSE